MAPRWWIAGLGVLFFVAGALVLGGDLFDFTPDDIAADSLSIGVNFHFGEGPPWIAMNRAMLATEVQGFAPWKPVPLLAAAALTALFSWLLLLVYQRGSSET